MAEAGTTKAAVTQSEVTSKHGALAELRAKREQDGTRATTEAPANAVSEAARALGQRSADVRRERQTPAGGNAQDKPAILAKTQAPQGEQPDEEAEDNPEGESAGHGAEDDQPDVADGDADDATGSNEPTIVIAGERLTATQVEESLLRQADYTRKTQDLAERGKVVDHAVSVVTQNSERINQLVGMLEQAVGQEPDWSTLALQMQPQQYLAYKEQWGQQRKVLDNVRNEASRNQQAAIAQAKVTMFDEAARSFRPEWQDRAKMQDGVNALANYAISRGIKPEELQMLHRTPMLQILDDSFRWNELQKSAKVTDKIVKGKPKPVRPGANGTRLSEAESQLQSATKTWESNQRPSTKDALRYLKERAAATQKLGTRA